MVHPLFSIAIYQRPTHRAFGLNLHPLTLGHIFLLREYHCKLLIRGSAAGLGHVLLAAFVCSTDHIRARTNLNSGPKLNRFLDQWGEQSQPLKLEQEILKFFLWWHENFAFAKVRSEGKGTVPKTVPEEWMTLAMLMSEFHMTREQAYATEYVFATALWAANGHRTGRHQVEPYGLAAADEAAWQHQHALDLAKRAAQQPKTDEKGESSCSA